MDDNVIEKGALVIVKKCHEATSTPVPLEGEGGGRERRHLPVETARQEESAQNGHRYGLNHGSPYGHNLREM